MSVAAVIVAGGRGERFGGPKQFAVADGVTLARRSVTTARAVAGLVVLVVPAGYTGDGEGADVVVTGGPTRSASVRAGLQAAGDADVIVIHDAVRPAASADLFGAVVRAVEAGADGAIPGLPLTDTVKRVRRNGVTRVEATVPREDLVAVQTPQAFRADVLRRAHELGDDATDDAALLEALDASVVVVDGESDNVKVTTPADLLRVSRDATP